MGIRNAGAILALAIQLSAVIAASPPGAPIVGCSAVGCPAGPGNSTSANCVVAGRKSNLIGLANFKPSIAGGDNLTWTETVGYGNTSTSPEFLERTFYLGAPQGFNLTANAASSNFGACAVFFTNLSAEAKFPGENTGTSFGTCSDAITTECVNALIEQSQLAVGPASDSYSCGSLKDQISKNVPPSCSRFATGKEGWDDIEVKGIPCANLPFSFRAVAVSLLQQIDLTGPNAPHPLTAAENSTSTCYPTLPKTNSLTNVATFNEESSRLLSDQTASIFAIMPILTVFFPKDNNSKALAGVEASLTCLKPIDESNASDATERREGSVKQSEAVSVTSKVSMLEFAMVILSLMMFA